jgi:Arc/MetJ-type ribon-helix-helix transcriptional regulator
MATTQKVTVTLSQDAVKAIRHLVATGQADSVSGFVQHAVQVSLDDVSGWGVMLAEALAETGGDMTPSERAWADEALGGTGSAGHAA